MNSPNNAERKEEEANGEVPELFHVWNMNVEQGSRGVQAPENVLSSGYMFKIYDVERENYMLTQLKPLLFTVRLLFKYPYVIDEKGKIGIQWFSIWTLYTIVGYVVQTLFGLELMYRLFGMVSIESDFILIVKIGVNILTIMTLLYTPLSALMEWRAYCIYFNQWIALQVDFEEITGKPFNTHMNLLIKIFIGVIAVQAYVAVYMGTNTLTQPFWYHKYVYMMVFLALPQQLFLWVVCQYESGRMATLLKDYIVEVFGNDSPMNNAPNAVRLRMLWLRLVYIVKLLGKAAFTIVVLLMTAGIVFLTGMYVILTGYIKGDSRTSGFLGPVLIAASLIVVICEFGHRTTVQVGADICEALVNLKSATMNRETTTEDSDHTESRSDFHSKVRYGYSKIETREEDCNFYAVVERFLRVAAFNAPKVSVAGLAVIDRSTLVSICKNVITYLIVLIQFQMTNDEDIDQTTKMIMKNEPVF